MACIKDPHTHTRAPLSCCVSVSFSRHLKFIFPSFWSADYKWMVWKKNFEIDIWMGPMHFFFHKEVIDTTNRIMLLESIIYHGFVYKLAALSFRCRFMSLNAEACRCFLLCHKTTRDDANAKLRLNISSFASTESTFGQLPFSFVALVGARIEM